MTYDEIRSRLMERGYNFTMLAEASGYTLQHVTQVAKGISQSRKVEKIIAQSIGLSVDQVFDSKPKFRDLRADRLRELKRNLSSQVA